MTRSFLALAALLALAVSSGGAALACSDSYQANMSKQTVASNDGQSSTPYIVPPSNKGK
jgi:hypothetical protein